MYAYRREFYQFLSTFAVRSAHRVVPKLIAALPIRSVVDFGCGQGAWLSVWVAAGASVIGVDGPYIDTTGLLIDPGDFHSADLSAPIDLGAQFDLVQRLEVAEHLPAAKAEQFVDTLVTHGSLVLFSAAVPGQGGENHVNERPLGYWRAIFRERGYAAIDYLRPLICDDPQIARWYRCNMILYVQDEAAAALPEAVRSWQVPDARPLDNYWPLPCRLQHTLFSMLPIGIIDRLSRAKSAWAAHRAGHEDDLNHAGTAKPTTKIPGANAGDAHRAPAR
jgi:SAM-dependent methyltransferase